MFKYTYCTSEAAVDVITGRNTLCCKALHNQISLESALNAYHNQTINYTLHKGAPLLSY